MELKRYSCSDVKEIRIHGRVSSRKTDGIPLFWTASAIEFNITGKELHLEYYCEYNSGESYLRVEIDSFDMYRFMLCEGVNTVCIMRGFGASDVKNVRIYRETQASSTVVLLKAILTDGEFEPLPERKYKIEFYGDSVTSGEGLAGARSLIHWIPAVFSCRNSYTLAVANAFDADWSVVSQSGWGIYADWTNNINNAIPKCYDKVCGPAKHESQVELGAQDPYDFESDKTNIAIINLGSNDGGAFGAPAWIDSDGVAHQLRVLPDGSSHPDDSRLIVKAVYDFCAAIRSKRRDAYIICCHHMLNDRLCEEIKQAAASFAADNGDDRVFAVKIPRATEDMKGARHHPGAPAHELYADALIDALKNILN